MSEALKHTLRASAAFGAASAMQMPHMPRINFAPPDDLGTGGDDAAAKAAAEAAAAEKAAAEKAAAEKAAADAAAAEAAAREQEIEAARKAGGEEAAKLLREVMEKKAKLKDAEAQAAALAAEKAQMAEQLKAFDGINLDEVKALLKEKQDRELTEAEKRGEFERVKQAMAEEHQKELKARDERITGLEGALVGKNRTIDELTVGSSFSGSAYITGELTLPPSKARQLYGSHFDVVDGKVVGYDKPAGKENRTPLVDAAGANLPFDAAMKKIIEADPEKETLIRSKIVPGGGSKTQQIPGQENKGGDKLYGKTRLAAALAADK